MRIKTIPVEKQDIDLLSSDELKHLADWGEHQGFKALLKIKDSAIKRRVDLALDPESDDKQRLESLKSMSGFNFAIDYLLESCNRAKEELGRRKDS